MWRRFSTNESWNRIIRSWLGKDIPSDEEGSLSGSVVSEAEAIAAFAELLENSLPGETPQIPNAVKATVAEAEAGTNDTKAVTPLGLAGAIGANVSGLVEHGNIYVADGTIVQDLSNSWSKPTGIFAADGLSSSNVTPDYTVDQIDIDLPGTYLVTLSASIEGELGYVLQGSVYLDGTRQQNLMFESDIEVTGSVSCSAAGTVSVTGSNSELEFYLKADAGTPEIKVVQASMQVLGIPVI